MNPSRDVDHFGIMKIVSLKNICSNFRWYESKVQDEIICLLPVEKALMKKKHDLKVGFCGMAFQGAVFENAFSI